MTPPSELPPPDVLDTAGRLRRLFLSLLVGIAAATAVYFLTSSLAKPDELPGGVYGGGQAERAYKFVFYMTGLAGVVAGTLTMLVLKWLARRREQAEQIPQAQARRRP
ncbi:MAG TPA: hypothetical protein VNO30_37970 [Kofleriaceae bacterium]|nr:hypothetical protein [Kofleriaceae bacterium]